MAIEWRALHSFSPPSLLGQGRRRASRAGGQVPNTITSHVALCTHARAILHCSAGAPPPVALDSHAPPAAGRPSRSTVTQQPRPVPLHISPPFLSLYLALSLCQKPAACARACAPCEACEFLRPRLRLRWQANWRARTHTLAVAASLAWSVARGSSRPSDRASISPARFFTSRSTTTAGGSCLLTA